MKNALHYSAIAAIALGLALTGCAGNLGTSPSGSVAANAAALHDAPPAVDGIAGEYSGPITDSALHKGTVIFELSQTGSSAGGSMTQTYGPTTASGALALDVAGNNAVSGTAVMLLTSKPCTVSIAGNYNPATLMLTGKYSAVNNCLAGQHGSFALKERCYYVVAKPAAAAARLSPAGVTPKPC